MILVKLFCSCYTVEGQVKAECLMLKPVTMELTVQRNLSSAWYHDVADLDIKGEIPAITVSGFVFKTIKLSFIKLIV